MNYPPSLLEAPDPWSLLSLSWSWLSYNWMLLNAALRLAFGKGVSIDRHNSVSAYIYALPG